MADSANCIRLSFGPSILDDPNIPEEIKSAGQAAFNAYNPINQRIIDVEKRFESIDPNAPDALDQYEKINAETKAINEAVSNGSDNLNNARRILYDRAFDLSSNIKDRGKREAFRRILNNQFEYTNNCLIANLQEVKRSKLAAINAAIAERQEETPPEEETASPAENQSNDDASTGSVSGEGQASTVVPQPNDSTSQTNAGTSSGDTKSPGPAGTDRGQEKPGKRLKNPLGNFASYTYQITLYMITPDAYDLFVQSGRKNINVLANATNSNIPGDTVIGAGAYIIAQSGGINNKTSQRAPGFETDFYIDNLKIVTATNGKSSLTAVNTTSVSFQIIEPYGFSFITKLKQASDALKQYNDTVGYKNLANASKQFFILGIRFQGYDINGNALTGKETLYGDPLDPQGTDAGIFEQFYDIVITSIKFKLDGKAVTYNITAAATAPQVAYGLKRGVINTNKALQGTTVKDVLSGPNGLFTLLTKDQEEAVKKKEIKIPNVYKVKYLGDAEQRIGNALIVTIADLDKWKWGGSGAKNTTESNDSTAIRSAPDPNERNFQIHGGTMLIQAVSQIIGQSTYLENAMKAVYKATTQPNPVTGSPEEIKNEGPSNVSWFNVSVELSEPKWDDQNQDWAYTMTFLIQTYETPVIFSSYSNPGMKYYGPHKRYEYWFTGQNSEVIEYSQNFDNLYFNVALNTNPEGDPRLPPEDNAGTEAGQVSSSSGLPQGDSTGKPGIGMQAQNSYITSLYDPGAFASAKLKIFGDPDFLVSESSTSISQLYSRFYGTNGYTVNANGGQVYVEVDFKEAVDYKNSTGILSINDSILFWQYPAAIAKEIKGVSYMVLQVTSVFNAGRFTQDLDLVINTFPGSAFEQEARDLNFGRENAASSQNAGAVPGDTNATSTSNGLTPDPGSQNPSPPNPTDTPQGSNSSAPLGNSPNDDENPTGTSPNTPASDDDGREPSLTERRRNARRGGT